MAVGTAGGLLDSPKSTSVFKHEILRHYSEPGVLACVRIGLPGLDPGQRRSLFFRFIHKCSLGG